jgi:hypothetical protein
MTDNERWVNAVSKGEILLQARNNEEKEAESLRGYQVASPTIKTTVSSYQPQEVVATYSNPKY